MEENSFIETQSNLKDLVTDLREQNNLLKMQVRALSHGGIIELPKKLYPELQRILARKTTEIWLHFGQDLTVKFLEGSDELDEFRRMHE